MKEKVNRKIFLVVLLFFIAPMFVHADVIESETINGNVFLKGKYVQIGINPNGTLGTSPIDYDSQESGIKAKLDKFALTDVLNGSSLGMRFNKYGWDSNKAPTAGDFTVSNTKANIDNINGSKDSIVFVVERKGYQTFTLRSDYKSDGVTITSVEDKTDKTNGLLKALVKGSVKKGSEENPYINFDFEIEYWFHEDATHYHTNIKVNNKVGGIDNLSVIKLLNPDQDKLYNRTSTTYSKVISRPRINTNADSGYSMVVARGETTLDGMFYLSFDKNSNPAINLNSWYNCNNTTNSNEDVITSSIVSNFFPTAQKKIPYKATPESLAIFYQGGGENGYKINDETISITTKLHTGEVPANTEYSTEIITSLDNDVIQGLGTLMDEYNTNIIERTDKTIKIKATSGNEYSIIECSMSENGEPNYGSCELGENPTYDVTADSNELLFSDLKPGTGYRIYYRNTTTHDEGSIKARTKKSAKEASKLNAVVITEDSVTVKGDHGFEYSMDGGSTWSKFETFNNLDPDTEYTFIGRSEATFDDMPGKSSEELVVKTLPKESTALDAVISNTDINFNIDVKIVDAIPTIKINKTLLYEAIKDDKDIVKFIGAADPRDVMTVVIDIIKLYPTVEEISDLAPYLKNREIAYSFDIELKVYLNDDHIKDITELSKNVKFSIDIPNEFRKENRNFNIVRKHIISIHEPALYQVLEDLDSSDETVTIENNLFSEFYVTYNAPKVKNPKTNDNIVLYIILLLISGFILYNKKRINI